ncbi:MAG TPA: hypothetical protein VKZ77_00230 [Bacillaceae bacterium]|nr:hypothetical protein [Bacillaceae bacterium]
MKNAKVMSFVIVITFLLILLFFLFRPKFNFIYETGLLVEADQLNTFTNQYTKILDDGPVTIDLELTKEEKKKILSYMKEIDFFDYPNEIQGLSGLPGGLGHKFQIQYGWKKKSFIWRDGYDQSIKNHKDFYQLTQLIGDIVKSKKEYKELPERTIYPQ